MNTVHFFYKTQDEHRSHINFIYFSSSWGGYKWGISKKKRNNKKKKTTRLFTLFLIFWL